MGGEGAVLDFVFGDGMVRGGAGMRGWWDGMGW